MQTTEFDIWEEKKEAITLKSKKAKLWFLQKDDWCDEFWDTFMHKGCKVIRISAINPHDK